MKVEKIIDNKNVIGSNIRRIRLEKKIGQTELVRELQLRKISITRETLVKIEGGRQHIKLVQLKA
ncbi:transcriptional regulator, partial [Enterococcus cecorum]